MGTTAKLEFTKSLDIVSVLFQQCRQHTSKLMLMEYFLQLLQLDAISHDWFLSFALKEYQGCHFTKDPENQNQLNH
jgi:hypothetical protein